MRPQRNSPRSSPAVLLALANAGRPRRAKHARAGRADNPFATVARAREFLAPLGIRHPIGGTDLGPLSELAVQASVLATALASGHQPPVPAAIGSWAAQVSGHLHIERAGTTYAATTEWHFPSVAAEAAHRLIEDLAAIDPQRLRECARPECTLLFYDTTRSSTQRWHAEDPCGWHERQARHRSKTDRPHARQSTTRPDGRRRISRPPAG